ncbi:copper chaperone PCu(A)C [Anianabacter salinae]|uniref:copper chaperone PCu(A)C n=1 Tax=Anianabacter salinae TaxID=2851023 RepID=UPI00225E3A1B|nr:copper chaperone PCu(A)C [Anianabacter salinae]MBV0911323.1 copper chaperone PCu(A)C [Anianabacter salinae]
MTKTFLTTALAAILAASPVLAEITVKDPYLRRVPPTAPTGAAFMTIENSGEADRLIDVRSDAAERVELHTHIDLGDGKMQMSHDEDGFEIPANGMHMLDRGADHVMFLGLGAPMSEDASVTVTLVFEKVGEITVEVPLDNDRMPMDHGGHGSMKHGTPTN